MGWMQGSPPPPDRIIRFADLSFYRFPQLRWSFPHWRELYPTVNVARGEGAASYLPRRMRQDIDALRFSPLGGAATMTWPESLAANYTEGIVVLHRGMIVYERYFGALQPERAHVAHSVTKSFVGTIAAMLLHEGVLDPSARIDR